MATALEPLSGSSPLARGTPGIVLNDDRFHAVHPHSRGEHAGPVHLSMSDRRFIPTRAGNTSPWTGMISFVSVHPHSRGEHDQASNFAVYVNGSSPLARGTRTRPRTTPGSCRFIPTRAGNTSPRPPYPARAPVHPHSRGEHRTPSSTRPSRIGSSPLARGTLAISPPDISGRRFIPTRAGNTQKAQGERMERDGSSPLARGTRMQSVTRPP